jgi:hypothetical protein
MEGEGCHRSRDRTQVSYRLEADNSAAARSANTRHWSVEVIRKVDQLRAYEAWLNGDARRPSRWANRSPYARRSRPKYPAVLPGSAPARARPRHAHNARREWPGLHRLGRYFYASLRVRLWQARPQARGRVVPDRYFRRAHHRECRSLPHLALWRKSRPRRLRPPGRRLVCSG